MKVKTDYVPKRARWYLTPGKVYDVEVDARAGDGLLATSTPLHKIMLGYRGVDILMVDHGI